MLINKPQLQALLKHHQPARKKLQWAELHTSEPDPPLPYANLAQARRWRAQQLIAEIERFAKREGVEVLGLAERFVRRNTHAKVTTYVFLTRDAPQYDHAPARALVADRPRYS